MNEFCDYIYQVWTVYCETLTAEGIERDSDDQMDVTQIIYDFWAKVTPTILNLMSHSRVVGIHFTFVLGIYLLMFVFLSVLLSFLVTACL